MPLRRNEFNAAKWFTDSIAPTNGAAELGTNSSNSPTDSIAGIGARVLGYASVAAMLHQVAIAQGLCGRAAPPNGVGSRTASAKGPA